jgi:hypothetical protein
MKGQDWLQTAFGLGSGAAAYVLWVIYQSDFHADAVVAALNFLGKEISSWVHSARQAFR